MKHNSRKPEWLRIKMTNNNGVQLVEKLMDDLKLNTVCREARCPNRCECYSKKTATFMIMGSICTRHCRFCNVKTGVPGCLDENEPENIARAVEALGLRYVVITSVTRDDLEDGGAGHFVRVIEAIREKDPTVKIEVLIPDLQGDKEALDTIVAAKPEVINHNIETVPRLYPAVRAKAEYYRSLEIIEGVKRADPTVKTKSGIMVGLGEERDEVVEVLKALRRYGCDYLTVGQYLRPSEMHAPMERYITPEEFQWYKEKALELGFEDVASGPLVRSSYNAHEMYR